MVSFESHGSKALCCQWGMLIIAAILLFEVRTHRRAWAWGAILPIGLALVLTMGRGMWISLFVGLGSLVALTVLDKQAPPRRLSRLFVVALIPLLLLAMGYIFQQQTRAAVSDIALDRVTRSVEAVGGRLISYGNALEKIRQRPLLGGGHGETVTSLVTFPPPPEILTVGAVDNVYLTIGMRMGLVGIAAFLWVFGFALLACVSIISTKFRYPRTSVLCGIYRHIRRTSRLWYGRCDPLCQSVDLYTCDIFRTHCAAGSRGKK